MAMRRSKEGRSTDLGQWGAKPFFSEGQLRTARLHEALCGDKARRASRPRERAEMNDNNENKDDNNNKK